MNYIVFLTAFLCFSSHADGKKPPQNIELPQFDTSLSERFQENAPKVSCGYTLPNDNAPSGKRIECENQGPRQLFKNDEHRGSAYSQDLMNKFQNNR